MIALLLSISLAGEADALLARVDAASSPAQDAHMVLTISSTDARGRESERTLEVWQKGTVQRLVKFTAPARVAGVALLVTDADTTYLYLPAYGRPRRVVGEARGDAFFGTNFAIEDLTRISWADEFSPTLAGPNHLVLSPKPDADVASARVELWVRPEDHLPARVEHYGADGAVLRRIAFSDVRVVGSRPVAHDIVVEDVAGSRTTRAVVSAAAFDQGVEDALFTVANLQP
jgi:outer membrane lipoprotein-sorting protein